jgi:hypothetical protein
MKFSSLRILSIIVLAAGAAAAQENPAPGTQATPSSLADEIKTLRNALNQQQQQIAVQQQQIGQQQQQIESLQKTLETKAAAAPHVENATLRTNIPSAADTAKDKTPQETPKESPLSFRIGGTEFTPGGFVDFENIFRTTNTGNSSSTSFGAIPFSNTVQGQLTEFRITGQYSRYNLKITGKYGANDITGYLEGDFNGNDPGNVFVTSNPHTNRLRLYWMDLKRGQWEFLGGQSWGWATPNRTGLSPMPADLAITIGEDANIHVGIPYTRAGTFRAVYHFTDSFQWGVAVENPQQFTGAGAVVFPFAFNAQIGGGTIPQFDNGNNPGTPNMTPDFWTKMAWDSNPGGRKMHFEAGGVLTTVKITFVPTVPAAAFQHDTNLGGGVSAATTLSASKNFRFLANALYGKNIGRYMIGLGPDAVVAPVSFAGAACTSTSGCGASISGIHAGTGLGGVEWQARTNTLIGMYYGFAYFQRNAFPDLTSPAASKPFIGFGGINSANSANRSLQEATIDINQTFWRHPQYGAVVLISQSSYLTRSPWFVAPGAPKNAHLFMQFLSLRYVLP